MRETRFIEQNRRKWARFEHILDSKDRDSDELSRLFTEVTDDLSYARTFYPNRSVRVYLNGVAQKVFYTIYKNRSNRVRRFWAFWKEDMPQILWEERYPLLISFLVFLFASLLGAFSAYMNPNFLSSIFPEEYLRMTYQNIERGEPMSVYQQTGQGQMFFGIAWNNLRVAALTFLMGLSGGIGTLYFLIYNGLMLGSFQAIFIIEGIYLDSILTIWIHGTIEIACIIVAGAGGLSLGRGLVFPGTYTRMQSLLIGARRGALIFLSLVPLILFAAFLESFVTRYTNLPYAVRAGIILASLAFVLYYFVILPYRYAKSKDFIMPRELELPPSDNSPINFYQIKTGGQLFGETFDVYRRQLKPLMLAALLVSSIFTSAAVFFGDIVYENQTIFIIEDIFRTFTMIETFLFPSSDYLFILQWLSWSVLAFLSSHFLQLKANRATKGQKLGAAYYFNTIVSTLVLNFLMVGILATGWGVGSFFALFLLFPFIISALAAAFHSRRNLFVSIIEGLGLSLKNFVVLMAVFGIMLLTCLLGLFVTTAPLVELYFKIIIDLFPIDNVQIKQFHQGFFIFINSFAINMLLPLLFIVTGLAYYSFRETIQARELFERLPQIKPRRKVFGMVQEQAKTPTSYQAQED